MTGRAVLMALLVTGTMLAGLTGCGDSERKARIAAMSERERFVNDIIEKRCIRCHTPPNPTGKAIITEPAHLLRFIDSDQIFDDIALYNAIMGGPDIPEHDRKEYQPTQAEMDSIRNWVLIEYARMIPDSIREMAIERGITQY